MMKRLIIIMMLACCLPFFAMAAWLSVLNKSNGVTPVVVIPSPLANFSRTVPASGGIMLCNTGSATVTGRLQQVTASATNVLEKDIIINAGYTYQSEWVAILDTTNSIIQFVGDSAFADVVDITGRYRDEEQ